MTDSLLGGTVVLAAVTAGLVLARPAVLVHRSTGAAPGQGPGAGRGLAAWMPARVEPVWRPGMSAGGVEVGWIF